VDRLEIVDATEALIGRYQLENIGAIDRLALPFAIEEHLRARLGHLYISKKKEKRVNLLIKCLATHTWFSEQEATNKNGVCVLARAVFTLRMKKVKLADVNSPRWMLSSNCVM
jgi:hypothetical protein